jgi:hypothetical protein
MRWCCLCEVVGGFGGSSSRAWGDSPGTARCDWDAVYGGFMTYVVFDSADDLTAARFGASIGVRNAVNFGGCSKGR